MGVRNRDLAVLRGILGIMQEIRALEERQAWQRERMTSLSRHLTGMPGGGLRPRGLDDAFAALSRLEEEHEKKCLEYAREMERAEAALNGIDEEPLRAFVVMKYMLDMPDASIREELGLTRRAFDRMRERVEEAESLGAMGGERA